ncbi:MAG: hypothetical protein J1F31_01505 [Erysipelotrichales bacterium]|nr:hypothetical protein [Erysipelotrichales bacterium]
MKNRKSILMVALSIFALAGCGNDNVSNTYMKPEIRINNKASQISLYNMTSFRDDKFNYFIFDLGTYENVPVSGFSSAYYYGGSGSLKTTLSVSTTDSNSVKNSVQSVISKTVTVSNKHSVNVNGQLKLPFNISPKVEYGYSNTKTEANTKSWTESYEETATFSETESRTEEISFNSSTDKAGYYYRMLLTDIEAYGIVLKNIDTQEYYAAVMTSVKSKMFAFVYSENKIYEFECLDNLDFDCSIIDTLALDSITPENYIDLEDEEKPQEIHFIRNAKDFYNINNNPDAYYQLVNNIDLEMSAECIENFTGILDGNDYTISNYRMTIPDSKLSQEQNYGMFKKNQGTIKNLTVSNTYFTSDSCHNGSWINTGGLVGFNDNGGVLENITVKDSEFKVDRSGSRTGGIAGINYGEIIDCKVQLTKFFSNGDCGGVVATNYGLVKNATYIGRPISGAVKSNTDKVMFDYWMIDTSGKENRGAKSWGGIVGYNVDNARIVNIYIQDVYMYLHGDDNGAKPKMGYAVGHNRGYISGTKTASGLGEYRSILNSKKGTTEYYFAIFDGLIGRNESTVDFTN